MLPGGTPRASAASSGGGHDLSITWLGTSSGNPTIERNVSCTCVQVPGSVLIVDCGEGSHRQLQQAGIDPAQVSAIYVTHLHGDHCFGIATTLGLIDAAKAAVADAAAAAASTSPPAAASSPHADSSARSSSVGGGGAGAAAVGELPVTHVCGPPGLAELLRVSLVLTGEHARLRTRVVVTELVLDEADAHAPVPLLLGAPRGCRTAEMFPAQWGESGTRDSGSIATTSGGRAGKQLPLLSLRRLASLPISHDPELMEAAAKVSPRLTKLPVLWAPGHWNRRHQQGPAQGQGQQSDAAAAAAERTSTSNQYSGWNYVAECGRFWELPAACGVTVRAAQLQHRVPCWGYVMSETRTRGAGGSSGSADGERTASPRKIALLGDTCNSAAIAPLALGCDVIAHEATFMAGMEDKCRVAQHSTGYAAGAFAGAVLARHLVLTHFSARYRQNAPPRMPGRGRGGGGGGQWRELASDEEQEVEEQARAVGALVSEARSRYGSIGPISAARDFHVVHVPRRAEQAL
ncbi:hypothetical protein FOA52_008997 [Chlamydomonas sp. UWO 241]|nr:hypothetical protein FOA52_008997 [Chlamydomonas sp. UWO 241]